MDRTDRTGTELERRPAAPLPARGPMMGISILGISLAAVDGIPLKVHTRGPISCSPPIGAVDVSSPR